MINEKPSNAFRLFKTKDGTIMETIPHKISDGKYVYSLPEELTGQESLVMSIDPLVIPEILESQGGYTLTFINKDGKIEPCWVPKNDIVYSSEESGQDGLGEVVFYEDEDRGVPSMVGYKTPVFLKTSDFDTTIVYGITVKKASEAEYATMAGSAATATKAATAELATKATSATSADQATQAINATSADYATNSGNAEEATHAVNADSATEAEHSASADTATSAESADYATSAGSSEEATHATTADTAVNADYATSAGTADSASEATHATSADSAASADYATSAGTADSATEATHAASADNATYATSAGTADTATEATHATSADSATTATSATSATTADTATEATYASSDHTKGTIEERLTSLGFKEGSFTISGASIKTTTTNVIKKQGKRCIANVDVVLTPQSEDIVLHIPEGFRPSSTQNIITVLYDENIVHSKPMLLFPDHVLMTITIDGRIVLPGADITNDFVCRIINAGWEL